MKGSAKTMVRTRRSPAVHIAHLPDNLRRQCVKGCAIKRLSWSYACLLGLYQPQKIVNSGPCREVFFDKNTATEHTGIKIGPGGRKAGREPKENNQKQKKPTEIQ